MSRTTVTAIHCDECRRVIAGEHWTLRRSPASPDAMMSDSGYYDDADLCSTACAMAYLSRREVGGARKPLKDESAP